MSENSFLCEVLITAVEGGINHWAATRRYEHAESSNGNLSVVVVDVDARNGFGWQPVNTATIFKGIQAIKKPDFRINPTVRETVRTAWRDLDASNIDAKTANAIVQAGLFGIVVYG